jgi:hypothetical protein
MATRLQASSVLLAIGKGVIGLVFGQFLGDDEQPARFFRTQSVFSTHLPVK